MVGVESGTSGEAGKPSSASDVLSFSSSPRSSFSNRADGGYEAGRYSMPSTRMNSRDSLLGSRRESLFGDRNGFGNAYFQIDDLGIYLSSVAVSILMGIIAAIGAVLFIVIIILAVMLSKSQKKYGPDSCASFSLNTEIDNLQGHLLPEGCEHFVARYVNSGQYHSDFAVAVGAARQYLNTFEAGQDGLDLVILDVDETSLSNMPYYSAHNYGVESWDEASWNEWVNSASAPALDPTLSLYRDLRAHNWSVGFITGRPESQGMNTAQNLYDAGYTGWASLILRKPIEESLPAVLYKAKYRIMLEKKGYRIRSAIGDQWSDLRGGHAGQRTFKLPNPMYYIY